MRRPSEGGSAAAAALVGRDLREDVGALGELLKVRFPLRLRPCGCEARRTGQATAVVEHDRELGERARERGHFVVLRGAVVEVQSEAVLLQQPQPLACRGVVYARQRAADPAQQRRGGPVCEKNSLHGLQWRGHASPRRAKQARAGVSSRGSGTGLTKPEVGSGNDASGDLASAVGA